MHATALLLLVALLTIRLSASIATDTVADERVAAALENFLSQPNIAMQYAASRHLEASGGGQRAALDVTTTFSSSAGFSYQVTGETGSGYIRSRVLRSLLEEERELIARGEAARVAVSRENYRFTPVRIDADGLAVVAIHPVRKARSLIAGDMFLTLDGVLVRIVGRLVKNPSFWTSRVQLVRSYRRINGVVMPVTLESVAQLKLFGSSALRMTYRYFSVNDETVVDTEAEAIGPPGGAKQGFRLPD